MAALDEEAADPLRWRGGYGLLWSAAVLSRLGDAVRNVAMPVVAAGLTTSPFVLSLVAASGYLPWLVFGLLGGALADRVDRRRAMWMVDLVRGSLLAVFALSLVLGQTHIALLAALAFALTTLQTLFDNAATAMLPALVPPGALSSANARLMTGQSLAGTFVGAPAAGFLVTASVAIPFSVNAATYLIAAVLIAALPAVMRLDTRPDGSTLCVEIREGVTRLWTDRLLRSICTANLLANAVIGGLTALLVLIVTRWIGASAAVFGFVLAAYGAGAVIGGLLSARVGRKIGAIRALVIALTVQAGCLVTIGTAAHAIATATALGVFGFAGMVFNVHSVTLTQQRIPNELLGRVSAALRTVGISGAPLGALTFGAVAELTDLNVPALLGAALMLLAAVAIRRGGSPRH